MYTTIFKRLIDIFASFTMLVLLSPILLIVAFIIKVQDKGSIFFKQERIGINGRPFKIYKFRSMPVNTENVESKEVSKIKITPFGKFIRRTNIDELPQLLNILIGNMSLVGPRPCIPSQKELIELRNKGGVYSCKPGLTGLAQVNSYDNMPNEIKAKYDSEYAKKITFIGDLKIILKTFVYLTKRPPTY